DPVGSSAAYEYVEHLTGAARRRQWVVRSDDVCLPHAGDAGDRHRTVCLKLPRVDPVLIVRVARVVTSGRQHSGASSGGLLSTGFGIYQPCERTRKGCGLAVESFPTCWTCKRVGAADVVDQCRADDDRAWRRESSRWTSLRRRRRRGGPRRKRATSNQENSDR